MSGAINPTRRATLQSLGPAAQHLYDSYAHADCEADPAHWSMALDDGIRAFAYDSTTLQSANPSAPPLDGELLARLQANPDRRWDTLGPLLGGWVLLRASKPGVCGLVQLKWSPPGLAATVVGNVVLLVVVLAAPGGTAGARHSAGAGFGPGNRPARQPERIRRAHRGLA